MNDPENIDLGGRPPFPPDKLRDRAVKFMVTRRELEALQAGARAAERNLAEYVRSIVLTRLGIAREEEENR